MLKILIDTASELAFYTIQGFCLATGVIWAVRYWCGA